MIEPGRVRSNANRESAEQILSRRSNELLPLLKLVAMSDVVPSTVMPTA